MKRILTIIFSLFIFISTALSQAYKIDEIGKTNDEDWTLRTIILRQELEQNPISKAFIIIHRGKVTKSIFVIINQLNRKNELNVILV